MKNYTAILLFSLITLTACSKKSESFSAPMMAAKMVADISAPAPQAPTPQLAYVHDFNLEVEENQITSVYTKIQAVCKAANNECTLLESHLQTSQQFSANVKFRATPATLQKLLKSLGEQGQVTSQSTTAEDLAGPIGDSKKKIEMLLDYRGKLEGLRGQASSNIDALIKINKELSEVQSELEEMSGRKAHLMQRVNTEILNLNISAIQNAFFWKKIALSFASFGSNLSEGISNVITAIAYLAPWVLALLGLLWALRKLWFRRKK
jgi:hypothetical protein